MGNFKKIFIIIFIVLCFLIFKNAKAATIDLTGWAWAGFPEVEGGILKAGSGWISFNCYNTYNGVLEDHCTSSNYKVTFDTSSGILSGYAWAGGGADAAGTPTATIGWISFADFDGDGDIDSNDKNIPGSPCAPNCEARLDLATFQVTGWARALGFGGGWDGWIKLRGFVDTNQNGIKDVGEPDYGVSFNTSTNEFEGWAWGGNDATSTAVVGWISFNCKDRNVCATSSYKVYLTAPLNQPPSATNLQESFQYCCIQDGVGRMGMSWTYNDPENTNQSAYGIWVQQFIGGTWVDKVYCEEIPTASPPSGGIGTSAVLIKLNPTAALCDYPSYVGDIEYGRQTRWRVKVKDGDGIWSDWTDWTTPTTTADHAYPWIDFSWTPQNPTVGQVVQFYDQSKCYDTAGTTTCSNSTGDSFFWTFQNGNPLSSTSQNPTTTFSSVGSNLVTLRVTDSSGYWCEIQKTVTSTYPLPFWKEILPPIFFKIRDFLASLIFSISKIRLF
jgi:PKD repeat protein